MWIRRGSFVVIDHTGKEKAQESGSKVTSFVCKVLFFEQIRLLQKSPEWPEIFRDAKPVPADESSQIPIPQQDGGSSDDSDDDMPPLEANTNRLRPFGLESWSTGLLVVVQSDVDKTNQSYYGETELGGNPAGGDLKREGAGRGNWGKPGEEVLVV
ncbi:hypothetical protein Bca4012_025644 [Brassica carinata]